MKLFVGAKALVHFQGKVLLIRESSKYAEGTETGKWDVPGGRIEPEEKVREGLIREVHEECGLTVMPGELLGVYDGFPRIGDTDCHVVRIYFLCEAPSAEVTLSDDHDAFAWVDPTDLGNRILVSDLDELLKNAQKYL